MKDIIVYALKIEAVQMVLGFTGMFVFTIVACLVGIPG